MLLRFYHNILFFLASAAFCYASYPADIMPGKEFQDTLQEKQFIYNGRIWRNMHTRVRGHSYFLTGEFVTVNLYFNGKEYKNLKIKYDIFDDEILLFINPLTTINLNKEMVERVSFDYEGIKYDIVNMGNDSSAIINGYTNILYEGPSSFYVKYVKKIEPMADENRYDRFFETHRMYIRRDSLILPFSGKKRLFSIMEDKKAELKDFIRKNRLTISRKNPYTFIPLIEAYDKLSDKGRVFQ